MPENRERKSHIKSRLGCSQCKARRVKCDEIRPQCGNCRRRQESCSYKNPNPLSTASPDASGSEQINDHQASAQLHLKQLALMHHYATSTYKTIAMRTQDPAVYQLELPRLACQHSYLLDAMFSLTSCHLAYERPAEAAEYVADAVRYQARALETYRHKLETLSPEDCQGVFHASALFGVLALAFRSVDPESTRAIRPTETMTQLARLWRGTALVLRASQQLLPPETYNTSFQMPIWDMRSGSNDTSCQAQIYLDMLRSRARAGDLVRPSIPEETSEDPINHCEVYLEAIDLLQELFQANRLEHSRIVAWTIMVPAQYMELLTQGQPIALAIALVYSVVMEEMEDFWWARPFRHQLVDQLVPVVSICDPQLAEMANWVVGWTKRLNELVPPAQEYDTVPLNDIGVDVPSLRLCRQEQGAVTQLEHLGLDKSMATLRAVKAGVLLQLDAAVEHMDCYSPPNSEERECSLSDLKT
ncbi:Zn(2)-C6 fungal-type transcription factor afumD [Fulvia fulva]|nr:Zn(2)-C6 fungal-type transcription factor afumD [Fulvia fulva]